MGRLVAAVAMTASALLEGAVERLAANARHGCVGALRPPTDSAKAKEEKYRADAYDSANDHRDAHGSPSCPLVFPATLTGFRPRLSPDHVKAQ
jgi:hypothetical protein